MNIDEFWQIMDALDEICARDGSPTLSWIGYVEEHELAPTLDVTDPGVLPKLIRAITEHPKEFEKWKVLYRMGAA